MPDRPLAPFQSESGSSARSARARPSAMPIRQLEVPMQNKKPRTGLMRAIALAVPFVLAGCNADGLSGGDRSRVRVVLSGGNGSATASLAAASVSASGDDDDDDDDRDKSRRLSSWFESTQVIVSSVMFRTLAEIG